MLKKIYLEVIFKKILGLINLLETKAFRIHKKTKIVIINEAKNFDQAVFKIMTLSFEVFNFS